MSKQFLHDRKTIVFNLLQQKEFSEAAILAKKLVEEYPDDFEVHLMQGSALLNGEQYHAAEKALKQTVEKFPDEWQANELLGYAYTYLNKIQSAEKEYRAALAKISYADKREIAELHCSLADNLWVQSKREEALDEWRAALKYNPKSKEAKQCLKECTNVFGEPKAPNDAFDELYHFQNIHIKRYFALVGREKFISGKEMQTVLDIVQHGWNNNIPPRLKEFDRMTPKEKSAFFKSITLDFKFPVEMWK